MNDPKDDSSPFSAPSKNSPEESALLAPPVSRYELRADPDEEVRKARSKGDDCGCGTGKNCAHE